MATTLSTEQVQDTIVAALEGFGVEPDVARPEATFESLEVDSLDLVELAQIIDERFGVELKAADVKEVATIADLTRLVVARA